MNCVPVNHTHNITQSSSIRSESIEDEPLPFTRCVKLQIYHPSKRHGIPFRSSQTVSLFVCKKGEPRQKLASSSRAPVPYKRRVISPLMRRLPPAAHPLGLSPPSSKEGTRPAEARRLRPLAVSITRAQVAA
jgi:hypothetical protein